jgi:hypothetical protein
MLFIMDKQVCAVQHVFDCIIIIQMLLQGNTALLNAVQRAFRINIILMHNFLLGMFVR